MWHLKRSFSLWARSALCNVFTSTPYSLPSVPVDGSAEVEKMGWGGVGGDDGG